MSTYSFYHPETGQIHHQAFGTDDARMLKANTPAGYVATPGCLDPLSQRIDVTTGEVVDYQPPSPSPDHEWNATTKRWQINAAVTAKAEAHRCAKASIAALEVSGVRTARELALGHAGALDRLKALDIEIAAQRLKL
jgi:hypothetical protein